MTNPSAAIADPAGVAEAARHRHPVEWFLFGILVLVGVAGVLIVIFVGLFGHAAIADLQAELIEDFRAQNPDAASLTDKEVLPLLEGTEAQVLDIVADPLVSGAIIILGVLSLFILIVLAFGNYYGESRAGAVRITQGQFPEVYDLWVNIVASVGIKKVPELYVINGNGVLNAYAACVPGFRHFSSINSDILEACLRNDDWGSLKFILGHELGHMKLGHVSWWYVLFTLPTKIPPASLLIGNHLSRAQEYGCDKIGHATAQDDNYSGLMMLAAGKHLYDAVEIQEYISESASERGFWMTLYNLQKDHPILAWRISALHKNHNGGVFLYRK